jgi:ribosomal protein S18 acetylase RimI-like enzyme
MPSPASDLEIIPLVPGEGLGAFTCGDADLDDFLATDAYRLQEHHAVRTYLARRVETGAEVLGFVSLMTDAVKLQTRERKGLFLKSTDHPIVPALKIARLGVSTDLQRGSGIGTALVRFAFLTGQEIAEGAGCRLLTLDAYPGAIDFYEKLGFLRNLEKEYRERVRPSMRLDLFPLVEPEWA